MHHFSLRPNEGRKVSMMESLDKHCDFNASFFWLHRSVATHVLHPMPRDGRQGDMATTIVKQCKDRRGAERKEKKTRILKKKRMKKEDQGKKEREKRDGIILHFALKDCRAIKCRCRRSGTCERRRRGKRGGGSQS